MLPSYLLDPTKKKNERLNRTVLGAAPPPPPPSLCITGALSRIGRYQVDTGKKEFKDGNDGSEDSQQSNHSSPSPKNNPPVHDNNGIPIILSYCIFRPRQLHDETKPPLLCLHGGPSIPSNYLLPIVNSVTDRAVIFYDQWGCGKSSRPQPQFQTNDRKSANKISQYPPFSIPTMVEHLRQLIEDHWKLKRFHLLGHSFGGILAYEYLLMKKRRQESIDGHCGPHLYSVILSSAPTSAELVQSESKRLNRNLTCGENNDLDTDLIDNEYNDNQLDGEKHSHNSPHGRKNCTMNQSIQYSEEFRQTHECRLPNQPLSLMDALAQIGPIPWRGIQAIDGYEAVDELGNSYAIPSLFMRGEYDFCTEHCMKGWKAKFWSPSSNEGIEPEERVLSNCSHYAMLEDQKLYGTEILKFLSSNDSH